jgi:PAB-dependent poly(A)-specific ribonuclease subunit 3
MIQNIVVPFTALSHNVPNMVKLKEAFSTKAFNDDSLVVVYEFIGGAQSLDKYLKGIDSAHSNEGQPTPRPLDESFVWSIIVQILTVMEHVHRAGFALRNLVPASILMTHADQLTVNFFGIVDLLTHPPPPHFTPAQAQLEDTIALGQLLLFLTTRSSPMSLLDPGQCFDYMSTVYSRELKNFILFLMGSAPPTMPRTAEQALTLLAPRVAAELSRQIG